MLDDYVFDKTAGRGSKETQHTDTAKNERTWRTSKLGNDDYAHPDTQRERVLSETTKRIMARILATAACAMASPQVLASPSRPDRKRAGSRGNKVR